MSQILKNRVLAIVLITACILLLSLIPLHTESQVLAVSNNTASTTDLRAEKIDTYFKKHNMKLYGYGSVFVKTADKYKLPYNFLPAITVAESTGGNSPCKKSKANVFGWGSCKLTFKTYEEAIDHVGWALSGGLKYYKSPKIEDKLWNYNTKVVPTYTATIKKIMKDIDK